MIKKFVLASLVSVSLSSVAAFADQNTQQNGTDGNVFKLEDAEQFESRNPRDRQRYEWVFSYIDRNDGCHSCTFECYAPRCSADIVYLKKACRVPNTKDDSYVYTCVPTGSGYNR